MIDFADICTWIALKHETKMVCEMYISFSRALENNTTLFPNYTSNKEPFMMAAFCRAHINGF